MFETAVIHAQAQVAPRRVGMLSASIGIHTFAGAAILIASLHSLRFPINAPNQMSTFTLPTFDLPLQKGDPNGGAKPKPQPVAQQKAPVNTPPRDTAPQTISDQTPSQSAAVDTTPGPAGDAGPGDTPGNGNLLGDPNGVEHGIPIAPAAPLPVQPETKIYRASEVNPPVVITRVSPEYPRMAMMAHKSGFAVVECVIDSTGHIRDAHVVGSSWDVFEKPALDAVQQWVFKPGSLNGQSVNTLFELRVTFTLH